MEPENHPFGKEKRLLNLHFGGSKVNFQGCLHPFLENDRGGEMGCIRFIRVGWVEMALPPKTPWVQCGSTVLTE